MTEFKAFRGQQDGKIVQSTGKVPELGQHDVLIKLTHAGLCFTDVRTCELLLNDTSDYLTDYVEAGIALGHEPVGKVAKLGTDVRHLKEGDVVGYGKATIQSINLSNGV